MSHKNYSKVRKTLDSFQKDYYKNPSKTDIDDDDTQTTSKTICYNMNESNQMAIKPILKPRSSRKKAIKSQIQSEDLSNRKIAKFKKPLKEIHVVESYKEYNIDVSEEGSSSWFCGFSCFFQKKMQK